MSASIRVRDLPPSFVLEQPDSTDIPLTILRLSFNGVKGNIDAPRRSALDPNLGRSDVLTLCSIRRRSLIP